MNLRNLVLGLLVTMTAHAQGPQAPRGEELREPTWPQRFEVRGGEPASFGFAVTKSGPITVDVQSQGAPIAVTLQSPGSEPITQQGQGNVRVSRALSPQDLQKSIFWSVQVRLVQPGPPQTGGRAHGSVSVQHPPANPRQVQAALDAQQQAVRGEAAKRDVQLQQASAQATAQLNAMSNERKARFDAEQQQRRAARLAQVQPVVDQMKRRGATSTPDPVAAPTVEPAPSGDVSTRAVDQPALPSIYKARPIFAPAAPPTITSLNIAQGQPGDTVIINGSGFGANGGEVHFMLGPNSDIPYTGQMLWYDNQILAYVPDISGMLATNGQLYVVRNPDKARTGFVPFRFEPAIEYRQSFRTADIIVGQPGAGHGNGRDIIHENGNPFWGYAGNDQLFPNTRLKNGWVLDNAFVTMYSQRRAGAYIQDMKVGTDWPYVNVRWWTDGCFGQLASIVSYGSLISIRGPKGVPDGLVVK